MAVEMGMGRRSLVKSQSRTRSSQGLIFLFVSAVLATALVACSPLFLSPGALGPHAIARSAGAAMSTICGHGNGAAHRAPAVVRYGGVINLPDDMKKGIKILFEGEPVEVLEFQASKRGRGGAILRTKLKKLLSGAQIEHVFHGESKYDQIDTEWTDATYSWYDGDNGNYVFMDSESFEEKMLDASVLGEKAQWLKEGMQVSCEEYEGNLISMQIKDDIVAEIVGVEGKKDSMNKKSIQITLDNGIVMQAPYYLDIGDKIKINPRNYDFQARV